MKLKNDQLSGRDIRRKLFNGWMLAVLFMATLVTVLPLFNIFVYVLKQGIPALNLDFFTQLPAPVGETGGGMANAMLGSLTLVFLAAALGVPVGIAAGVFLSEYKESKLAHPLRFGVDLLTSIPSIIVGIFAYALVVRPIGHFSAYAGALALAIIIIPIVARTTEEILRLVPVHIREAGLALGIPRWRVILVVVLKGTRAGVITGVMLAVARAAGETAPLIFTALNNKFWARSLDQPIASLPVTLYNYAISPYEDWHRQAWAAALVLMVFVLVLNLVTRLTIGRVAKGRKRD